MRGLVTSTAGAHWKRGDRLPRRLNRLNMMTLRVVLMLVWMNGRATKQSSALRRNSILSRQSPRARERG